MTWDHGSGPALGSDVITKNAARATTGRPARTSAPARGCGLPDGGHRGPGRRRPHGDIRLLGPVRSIFVDQPGASGAVDRKAEDRPRTGRTWPTPTTRRGAVPGVPGPRRSAGQDLAEARAHSPSTVSATTPRPPPESRPTRASQRSARASCRCPRLPPPDLPRPGLAGVERGSPPGRPGRLRVAAEIADWCAGLNGGARAVLGLQLPLRDGLTLAARSLPRLLSRGGIAVRCPV